MMDTLADWILDPEIVLTVLAALAMFLAAVGFLTPYFAPDRLKARLDSVGDRRRELRVQQVESRQRRSRLRRDRTTRLKAWVDRLKLRDALAGDGIRQKLLQANWRGANALPLYVTARLGLPFALGGLAALMLFGGHYSFSGPTKLMGCFAAFAFGYYLPPILLTNAIQRRQIAFARAFPDALDLLLICVESGLSLEAGLSRVAAESSTAAPILAEELELTTAEMAYLPDRRQALENLAMRVNLAPVRSVCSTLIQAEKYGTPLTAALRVASQENREARMAAAEKKAGALPAQLTVPMVVFFLPVLFIVILGPAIIQIINGR